MTSRRRVSEKTKETKVAESLQVYVTLVIFCSQFFDKKTIYIYLWYAYLALRFQTTDFLRNVKYR